MHFILLPVRDAALGTTTPEIDLPALADLHVATIEKSLFSMMVPEVTMLLRERPHVTSVVLFGIEVSLPDQTSLSVDVSPVTRVCPPNRARSHPKRICRPCPRGRCIQL